MAGTRIKGVLLCLASVILAALFVWGIYLKNYWALAIPLLAGVLALLALTFWIGWTLALSESELAPPTEEGSPKKTTASTT
jgi:energy-coupling factor transporter transmembrane protein EcfT